MRTAVMVSFDLIRPGEPPVSLAMGSILASLARDVRAAAALDIHHVSVNLLDMDRPTALARAMSAVTALNLGRRDVVAVSAYVWSEHLTQSFIAALRANGFEGTVVLGGYQVSYASRDALPSLYPGVDVFVASYAEQGIRAALLDDRPRLPRVIDEAVDFETLPSPYLSNCIPVEPGQGMVRLESKRGCPYRCSFCAHRDLRRKAVHPHSTERVRWELSYMAAQRVGKINFVDPVFNQGDDHLGLMEYMAEIGLRARIALQSRFEAIKGANGERFIDLAKTLDAHLEFGLQTAVAAEGRSINRSNRMDAVAGAMRSLAEKGISYEVSLIYGLPGQTVASFRESIRFVRENGCTRITAWPLMLLRGTELMAQREEWGFEEAPSGPFDIPVVRRSNSYTEQEWLEMQEIANGLAPNARI